MGVYSGLAHFTRGIICSRTEYTRVYSGLGRAGGAGAARAAPILNNDSISSMGRGSAEPPKILLPYRQWPPHFFWASDAPGARTDYTPVYSRTGYTLGCYTGPLAPEYT